jgi:putative membrane protein
MMFFGMGFGILIMIIFWGGLIMVGVWIVRNIFRNSPQLFTSQGVNRINDANETLKQRYARGEISREEFEAMSRDLK